MLCEEPRGLSVKEWELEFFFQFKFKLAVRKDTFGGKRSVSEVFLFSFLFSLLQLQIGRNKSDLRVG